MATLQHAWEVGMGTDSLGDRQTIFGYVALGAAVLFLRPWRIFREMGKLGRRDPGLIAAFGGATLGAILTMHDFVDNLVEPSLLSAGLALLVLTFMLRSTLHGPAAERAPRTPLWIAAGAAVLIFAGTRVLGHVLDNARWVHALGEKMSGAVADRWGGTGRAARRLPATPRQLRPRGSLAARPGCGTPCSPPSSCGP